MKSIYLDYAATTPADPAVVKAMLPYFTEHFGNPSSLHSFGQEAKRAVETARASVASLIGAQAGEIVFTSGGTESDNFALKGAVAARKEKGNHIITTVIEHHAVLETCHDLEQQGCRVTYLPVDRYGAVDPDAVKNAVTNKTILISIMHANNEVGTIQPLAEIGKIARANDIYFHTDAVQTFGHIPIDVNELNVDLLSASGHKLYGPKGVGIIYIRKGTRVEPFLRGGGQEKGRRSSTHNVPGIVGMGKASELSGKLLQEEAIVIGALRDKLIRGVLDNIDETKLNGHATQRLPNNVNITINYIEGEAMVMNLDIEGIACSSGSSCSSASSAASHVLVALGPLPSLPHGSLRFSLGKATTAEDIDTVLMILPRIVRNLRSLSPRYRKKEKLGK
ncbi:MAG: cysteine desulfurase NifS [Syntrophales bacterium]|jgi:cysteine desulfurase|nr:cysteine desulfurase NifS [Syntrophales bacterium]